MQFEEFLTRFKEQFEIVASRDLDYTLAISGAEGLGKSTLALHIAKCVDKNFEIDNVFFSDVDLLKFYDKIISQISRNEKKKVYVFDEAQNIFARRNYSKNTVKDFLSFIKTARFLNNLYIFNTPTLSTLDSELLRRLDALLFVKKRGVALFFVDENLKMFVSTLEKTRRQLGSFCDECIVYEQVKNEIKPNAIVKGIKKLDDEIFDEYYNIKRERALTFINYIKKKISGLGDEDE